MKRPKKVLLFILALIGILLLAYLLRNVEVPPDCESEPTAPACQVQP